MTFVKKVAYQRRVVATALEIMIRYALLLVILICEGAFVSAQHPEQSAYPELSLESDWPWWRGPNRDGTMLEGNKVPTNFSNTQSVVWKAKVPGRGHSSPIVVGDLVFLTTCDTDSQTQLVLSFDKNSGKVKWQTQVSQGGLVTENHDKNTEATPTIACDGERLFATFLHHNAVHLICLGLDGEIQYQKVVASFEPQKYKYGYAPSPLLYRGQVMVVVEQDGVGDRGPSVLASYKGDTGAELWKTPRPIGITFSSPVIARVAGLEQVVISGSETIRGYDPLSGKQLWAVPATTAATCGTVVWNDRYVFASGGYPGSGTFAVEPKNSLQPVWSNEQKCYEQSMIVIGDYLYALTDKGVLYCWSTSDGSEMWKQRLAGPVSTSPIYAGGFLYFANESGTYYVIRPNPQKYDLVSQNKVGDEAFASPAVSGGKLFLRTAINENGRRQEYLYCFGE